MCAELWGAGMGKEEAGISFDLQMLSFQTGCLRVSTVILLHVPRIRALKALNSSLMDWGSRILNSGSHRDLTWPDSNCLHSLFLVCKRRFSSSWGWYLFLGRNSGTWEAGKCNNVCRAFGVPWKKIQGISLITVGLPIPLNSENPFKWLLHEEATRKARLIYLLCGSSHTAKDPRYIYNHYHILTLFPSVLLSA
jgi:hypothetical protein